MFFCQKSLLCEKLLINKIFVSFLAIEKSYVYYQLSNTTFVVSL